MPFKLMTTDLGSGVSSVAVGGEVDLATAPALESALTQVIASGPTGVLVDLSRATFIDSTTLSVLMGAAKRLQQAHGGMAIACRDANVRKIFTITLLDRVFDIFDTPEAGVEHLRREPGLRARSSFTLPD